MIGPDKQHSQWLVSYSPSKECTLWVPCHLNSRTSATQAPSATNICETSSSVNICRRNRTLFDNYSVLSFDNISHCRPSDATCHVFTFSPFTLLELEIFSWGNVNHFFPWQHIHSWGLFCTVHNVTIGSILIVIIFFFLTTLCGTDGSPAYSPLLGLPSPGPDGRHPTNKRTHISFLNHISSAIHLYTCCTLCFWLRIPKKVVKL